MIFYSNDWFKSYCNVESGQSKRGGFFLVVDFHQVGSATKTWLLNLVSHSIADIRWSSSLMMSPLCTAINGPEQLPILPVGLTDLWSSISLISETGSLNATMRGRLSAREGNCSLVCSTVHVRCIRCIFPSLCSFLDK